MYRSCSNINWEAVSKSFASVERECLECILRSDRANGRTEGDGSGDGVAGVSLDMITV